MGLEPYVNVVFGVKETQWMQQLRTGHRDVMGWGCENGHETLHSSPRPQYCSVCAKPIIERPFSVGYMEHPAIFYAEPGLDPRNRISDMDKMINTWIHGSGDVFLGLSLLRKDCTSASYDMLPSPTEDQKTRLDEFLTHVQKRFEKYKVNRPLQVGIYLLVEVL